MHSMVESTTVVSSLIRTGIILQISIICNIAKFFIELAIINYEIFLYEWYMPCCLTFWPRHFRIQQNLTLWDRSISDTYWYSLGKFWDRAWIHNFDCKQQFRHFRLQTSGCSHVQTFFKTRPFNFPVAVKSFIYITQSRMWQRLLHSGKKIF